MGLVLWALLDPNRFREAGPAIGDFSTGFASLLSAPFRPIGEIGGELMQLGAGVRSFGGDIGETFRFILDPLQGFVEWASSLVPWRPASATPSDVAPTVPYTFPDGTTTRLVIGDPTYRADWADTPATQFLEETLLRCGWRHG